MVLATVPPFVMHFFGARKDLGDPLGQYPQTAEEEMRWQGCGGRRGMYQVEEGHQRTPAVGNRVWARTQPGLLTPYDCILPVLPSRVSR